MQKMKNGKKVLSVCLSLAMAAGMLSTSAFASWNVYGGSNNHNAVVTEAPTAPDNKVGKRTGRSSESHRRAERQIPASVC